MSEHLLKILLTELRTVRIRCKSCGSVVEMPVENLATRFQGVACPLCRQMFIPPGSAADAKGVNPFVELAKAMDLLGHLAPLVEIEFSLPAKE